MALSWCLQSEDPSLATLVAEQILDSCQNLNNDDLISCLNSLISVKSSIYSSNATLLFLSKYKDFCDYQRSGKLREAVDLLTQLLIRKAAPRRFWLNLLEDLLLLLQGGYKDNLFQNSDILYNLITFVETLNIEIETTKVYRGLPPKTTKKRSNIQYYRDLMHDVRLYLNKCMLYCNIS